MRVNFAPVKNFKRDVGVKTTYDFSNREDARRLVERVGEFETGLGGVIFLKGSSPTNRRKRIFEPLVKKYGKSLKVQFLHPGLSIERTICGSSERNHREGKEQTVSR